MSASSPQLGLLSKQPQIQDDKTSSALTASPKIMVPPEIMESPRAAMVPRKPKMTMKQFYIHFAWHMLIPLYGAFVLIFQFVPLKNH